MDDLISYQAYLDGDDQALGNIVEKYNKNLVLFITQYTHNIEDAEDIAADTFLKLITKKPRFNGNSSFKTWLYRIAINNALNFLKKSKKGQTEELDDNLIDMSVKSVENEVITSEETKMVHQALKELDPSHSTVLRLYYIEGFSHSDISTVLKMKPKKVSNILYLGKKELKEKLIQMGYKYEDK